MATSDRTLIIEGNRLTLLPDGPQRLRVLIDLIDGARASVRMLYYIYTADRSGAAVRSALIRALDRGVAVSLLIDGFGSSRTNEGYFRDLADKGATFCRFNPSYGRRYLLRNHQKLTLADGTRILIGG
ncbi:MAG TPA: phospholipase D-like domain-containing protein, partial [Sphingomicrobium sp.]